MKTFTAFLFHGKKFLAIPINENTHIISETGENFGSFHSVENFKAMWSEISSLGQAFLSLRTIAKQPDPYIYPDSDSKPL